MDSGWQYHVGEKRAKHPESINFLPALSGKAEALFCTIYSCKLESSRLDLSHLLPEALVVCSEPQLLC